MKPVVVPGRVRAFRVTLRMASVQWSNPLPERMVVWALRLKSPSLGRVPTLREAWTGRVILAEHLDRLEEGAKNRRPAPTHEETHPLAKHEPRAKPEAEIFSSAADESQE